MTIRKKKGKRLTSGMRNALDVKKRGFQKRKGPTKRKSIKTKMSSQDATQIRNRQKEELGEYGFTRGIRKRKAGG
jgi:hypothetical protein